MSRLTQYEITLLEQLDKQIDKSENQELRYQFLSLKFNYTGSILAGVIFTLAAVLLGTTDLGTGIWYYFPFVYPIKLIYGYVSGSFNVDTVIFYLFISLLLSFVSVGIFSFWYNRWDGTSEMEE